MKSSSFEEPDTELLQWVSQVRRYGTQISGPIIAAKAKQFSEILGLEGTSDADKGSQYTALTREKVGWAKEYLKTTKLYIKSLLYA